MSLYDKMLVKMDDSSSSSSSNNNSSTIPWPFPYTFSEAAAVIFTVLFGLAFLVHTFQALRTRTWFLIPFLVGVCFEALGYAARFVTASHYPMLHIPEFAVAFLLPFVSPTLMAASLYMELGRIIRMCDAAKFSIIRPTWLTKIFVLGDIVTLLGQFIGGGIAANPKASQSAMNLAKTINTFAFALQLCFLALYICTAALFHRRYAREEMTAPPARRLPWKLHIYALYYAISAILLRSTVHLIEYAGSVGLLENNEWPTYVFDAAPICSAVLLLNWVHASEVNALRKGRGLICKKVVLFHRVETSGGKYLNSSSSSHNMYSMDATSAESGFRAGNGTYPQRPLSSDEHPLVQNAAHADNYGAKNNVSFRQQQQQQQDTQYEPLRTQAHLAPQPYSQQYNARTNLDYA